MGKRKKQKNSAFKKIVAILIVVAIFAYLGYNGYLSYQKASLIIPEINEVKTEFNKLEDATTTNISLFNKEFEYIKITYTTSNSSYITETGVVTRPTYTTGDKFVDIVLNIELINATYFDSIFLPSFGVDTESITKKIKVIKLDQTPKEKLEDYLSSFDLPRTIYSSMKLPTSSVVYPELEITYKSDNDTILSNLGVKNGVGKVKYTVTFKIGSEVEQREYDIEVLDVATLEEVKTDFYNFEKTRYNDSVLYEGLTLSNCVSEDEKLKFRIDDELSIIETNLINKLKNISFTYEYKDKQASYTKDTYIRLYYSTDKENYTLLLEEILNDSQLHTFSYSDDLNGYFKIVISSDYANGRFLLIDDFYITRGLSEDDIITAVLQNIPNKVSRNIDLITTTPFGGIITYNSTHANFTKNGVIKRLDNPQQVSLQITIEGFGDPITFSKEIQISGLLDVIAVEIRFIDLGKYGDNDCGEAIYIKYGDIDILIDAGDDYKTTVQAVLECINTYSNDLILDYVIATHPDSDHIGGMNEVLEAYQVLNVIRFANDAGSKKIYPEFNEAVLNEECNVCTSLDSINNVNGCSSIITLGDEVFIEIIDTSFYDSDDNNTRSIVCVLNAYGVRTLFTGDGDNNKKNVEEAYKDKVGNIDILKVVHHGTRNGTTIPFLQTIDPEVAIITNGNYFGNKHGHPTIEAINNLYNYDAGMLVYAVVGGDSLDCTYTSSVECNVTDRFVDRNGMITIVIDNNGYEISSELQEEIIEIKDTKFFEVINSLVGN